MARHEEEIRCPYCNAATRLRVLWTLGNLIRVVAIGVIILAAFAVALVIETLEPADATRRIRLQRKCSRCGGRFMAGAPLVREPLCGSCGYNLTGNVSGICPECGWKLTRRMQRRVRRTALRPPPAGDGS
jgi:ribosomal protein S27AE